MTMRYVLCCLILCLLAPAVLAQNEVTLTPIKDNTLYESATGDISNGAGPHLYAGRNNQGNLRRALLAFDVANNLPADAQIESVTLTLTLTNEPSGAAPITASLHRVQADWGEGASNAGSPGGSGTAATTNDATWLFRFFDSTPWTTPGGDFDDTPSASTTVDGPGTYTWSSTNMVGDVQDWLERPEENFGWILLGEELVSRSARRFESRESSTPPTLTITYSMATASEDEALPAAFHLEQNYPNPFNPVTTIAFTLATSSPVRLVVYDLLGHEVRTLVDGVRAAGRHEVAFDAGTLPSGLYLYRLTAGATTQTRTMTLLK